MNSIFGAFNLEEVKSKKSCQISALSELALESEVPEYITNFLQKPVPRKVAYWARKGEPNPDNLPVVQELLNTATEQQIEEILNQSKVYRIKHYWLGHHVCYICQCPAGTTCRTDGIRIWPESMVHYLKDHNVLPPNW